MGQYVGSLATQLKKTVKTTETKVASSEETKERKNKFLSILDKATEEFLSKLDKGSISINNIGDLERIIKLTLLVSGEANVITGSSDTETEVNTTNIGALNADIDSITQLLDNNDPQVKAVYDMLFNNYNNANDESANKKK